MDVVRPRLEPDPGLSRERMEALQRDIADASTFADDLPFDPADVSLEEPLALPDEPLALPEDQGGDPTTPGSRDAERAAVDEAAPVVVGVDQAFLDDRAVSAVVAIQDDRVVDRASALTDLEVPYIPGLLAFREGRPILAALAELSVDPDLLVLDGSGRIHFRQAGIATHVGVMVDVPAVGVAKNLLCGIPERTFERGLPDGKRVPILAADAMDAPEGTVVGHAYQSRQYDSPDRHVNPLYVSPGHRVGADTATDLVAATAAGYKLPEPIRLADAAADAAKVAAEE